MILSLLLLALGGTALLISSLEAAQRGLERDRITERALAQAKAAVIGYAARDDNRPGSLPCPDPKAVPDGTPMDPPGIPYNCTSASGTRIGRLPWRTLGLPELRDGSGELLWYVVSDNNRATNTTALNSDTLADVDGDSSSDTHGDIELRSPSDAVIASNLVALVIAPGRIQAGQTRPGANPAEYLELQTTSPTADDDDPGPFVKNVYRYRRLGASNDVVLPISHADLFTVVDQAVFARMRRTLVPKMQALAAKWTRYPFAMPFAPSEIGAKGVPGIYEGSLPWAYTSTAPATQWQSPAATLVPSGTPVGACSVQADPTWVRCDIPHAAVTAFNIDVFALGAGLSFNDVGWRADYGGLLTTLTAPSWSVLSTDSAGNASVRFTATTPATPGSGTLTVWLQVDLAYWADINYPWIAQPPPPSACTPPADDMNYAWPRECDAIWFVKNGWYRQTYYAIAPGVAFGGSGCTPGTDCLVVGSVAASTNDTHALLVLAGRPVNGAVRPSILLDDYVEGENRVTGDRLFESGPPRKLPPNPRNDNIAILAP